MKFAKSLSTFVASQPETWQCYFISYKELKKCCSDSLNHSHDFYALVDKEISKVNKFYSNQSSAYQCGMKQLENQVITLASPLGKASRGHYQLLREYLQYLLTFLHTHNKSDLEILQHKLGGQSNSKKVDAIILRWIDIFHLTEMLDTFAQMNFTGFRKIFKKHSKKSPDPNDQAIMYMGRIHVHPLAAQVDKIVALFFQQSETVITMNIPVLEDYTCGVCLDILYHPVMLKCKHHFCTSCLIKLHHRHIDKCPLCRTQQSLNPSENSNRYNAALHLFTKTYFPLEYNKKTNEEFAKTIQRAKYTSLMSSQ